MLAVVYFFKSSNTLQTVVLRFNILLKFKSFETIEKLGIVIFLNKYKLATKRHTQIKKN
jgi:hypothetical protein